MAARLEPAPGAYSPKLVDLRELRSQDLDSLLAEEIAAWHNLLDWDFSKSADLVRRYVDLRSLSGCALVQGREAVGYAYCVMEDHKGLIGDLFVRREFRTVANENRLLEHALDTMLGTPEITRVEAQLMMATAAAHRLMPRPRYLSSFLRNFMVLDLERTTLGPARRRAPAATRIYYDKWSEHYQEPTAQLIAAAYLGHVDSLINDQYRSLAGARRFLFNIVQYPGCGLFFRPASIAAFDRIGGHMCGVCLASLVMPDCGHITQLCVAPGMRGTGGGYELLRQSLLALRAAGCRKTSLTVTASNHEAIRLYEDVGFATVRQFSAFVWEGF